MTDQVMTRVERRRRRAQIRRRRRIATLLAVAGLATPGGLYSLASFTDQKTAGSNTVTTGSVVLGLTPAAQTYTFSLAPGETFTTPITVANTGASQLRYAVAGFSDATDANFVASRMTFTGKTGVTTCTNAGFGASGTTVGGPVQAASTTGANVVGVTQQGSQPGDRILNPGTSEVLCVQVGLPVTAGGSFGGRQTTITYQFIAEQTANNP